MSKICGKFHFLLIIFVDKPIEIMECTIKAGKEAVLLGLII